MIKKKLTKSSYGQPEKEVCGFIVLNDNNFDFVQVENLAEDKGSEFYISAKTFLHTKENYNVVAVFHSHPCGNEQPSDFDKSCSEATCYPFVIYSNKTRKFGTYIPEYLETENEIFKKLEVELC